jgi:hypothetical protein
VISQNEVHEVILTMNKKERSSKLKTPEKTKKNEFSKRISYERKMLNLKLSSPSIQITESKKICLKR